MKKSLLALCLLSLLFFVSCENQEDDNEKAVLSNTNEATSVNEETNRESVYQENNDDETQNTIAEKVDPMDQEIEVGEKMPNFEFTSLDGEKITLEDYKGKIILLNFWASWCTYCDQEMPDLDKVHKSDDVVVLAVNSGEKKDLVESYINNGNYGFITALDEDGILSEKFQVNALPVSYFIDEEGNFIGYVPSMLTLDQMEEIIQNIRDDYYN